MIRRQEQAAQGRRPGAAGAGWWREPPRTERRRNERRRTERDENDAAGPLARAASLAGESVVTSDGEPIGNVDELMLDVRRGRIAYAVVAYGGFMGLGERLHPIPWCALTLDEARHCLVLDADRATFVAAPCFDKEHWPDAPPPAWHHALHRHYGCRPYWK